MDDEFDFKGIEEEEEEEEEESFTDTERNSPEGENGEEIFLPECVCTLFHPDGVLIIGPELIITLAIYFILSYFHSYPPL